MPAPRPSEHLNAAEFVASADDVFGRIASRYDLLCDLFSFWLHRHWKRRVATLVASQPWQYLLDSASGTGDIVLRVLNCEPSGAARRIVASDISPQMLAIAKQRLAPVSQSVELRQLDAHSMPSVPSDSVDLYSISLGLNLQPSSSASRGAACIEARWASHCSRSLQHPGSLAAPSVSALHVGLHAGDWLAGYRWRRICLSLPAARHS
jgi:SAM-dependent methyltransferase